MKRKVTLKFFAAASSRTDIAHVHSVKSTALFAFSVNKTDAKLDSRHRPVTRILVVYINAGRHRSVKGVNVQIATGVGDVNGTLLFGDSFATERSNLLARLSVYIRSIPEAGKTN